MLHLPRKQTDELIKALMMAAEQFKNVQDSARPFAKYLKKEVSGKRLRRISV